VQVELAGKTVTITGISKGSGMIRPDMATMLAYIATDANVDYAVLTTMLNNAMNHFSTASRWMVIPLQMMRAC